MIQLERERLEDEPKRTGRGGGGGDESINLYAQRVGAEKQAKMILSNPPLGQAADYLSNIVNNATNPRGATFSKKYGDMTTLSGNSASKQRSANLKKHGKENGRHHRKQSKSVDNAKDVGLIDVDAPSDDSTTRRVDLGESQMIHLGKQSQWNQKLTMLWF